MTDFPARKSNAHKYYSKLKVNKTRTYIRRDWDTFGQYQNQFTLKMTDVTYFLKGNASLIMKYNQSFY